MVGILGGLSNFGAGAFVQKTYTSLPPHFKKRIRLRFVKIDSWENENVNVFAENILRITQPIASTDSFIFGSQCGDINIPEYAPILAFEYASETTSMTLKITTDLNQASTDEAWGFRDVYVAFQRCHASCFTCTDEKATSCKTCYSPANLQADNSCLCPDGYYMTNNDACTSSPCSHCTACISSCKTCSGGNTNQCLSCFTGKNISYYILLYLRKNT